jgi:spore germination cell wall hydrolase CwlJ-like protein
VKLVAGVGIAAVLLFVGARAQGERSAVRAAVRDGAEQAADWNAWSRPLQAGVRAQPRRNEAPAAAAIAEPAAPDVEVDVVDAHWMALTMWGEARNGGEEAMRAVGHVIDNRRRSGRHGAYATETVSEAWQFSAWNANDPNRARMMNIHALADGSREQAMWVTARRVADEILAGRSADPTGGALFYHTTGVSPRWSREVEPTAYIGGHLFFSNARGA